ncbi:MAG: histidinol-phosphate transaminase, partial [Peptidiphaga gingivicola]
HCAARAGHTRYMSKQQWFRPEILGLPAYVPGKKGANTDVVKLSSNENPFPALPAVQAAVSAAVGDLNRYPDMFATGLVHDISWFHKWVDDGVVVGNGSTSLIEKILQAVVTPGGEVVLPWRSFEAYPIAVQAAGGAAVKVPLNADGSHNLPGLLSAVTERTRALLLCSPNNPTGVALKHTDLAAFLAKVPERVPVLLDEAYIDFVDMDDAVRSDELLREHPNLIVLRTFSKAYGLAGIRVGYGLGHPEMIAGLRAIGTPFGVNALAQIAASAALHSQEEVRARCGVIVQERKNLVAALAAHDIAVPASQANFVWLAGFGEALENACLDEGVTVRRFGQEGVRVSVGETEGSLRLLRAVASIL